MQQAPYTSDLQWNRVSNLEPSGSKAEILPLGYRDLNKKFQESCKLQQLFFILEKSCRVQKRKKKNSNHINNLISSSESGLFPHIERAAHYTVKP
ncbi:hypothetical protein AVEN_16541-1 [Araneus ventricosus]|uniref:Uncharacterized protein n=1 Tax=Araneus ventricosus TaxID=182803 RepID=A0A4Y2TTY6_ARAVE|nr:hypothetical protein AVEN_16541-1 [Araneus ventricosus]